MKSISTALKNHLALSLTTLATCWKLTRTDGVVMGFTDHDTDILYDSVTYVAATGLIPSDTKVASDGSVDNSTAYGILNSAGITNADLSSGVYDFAALTVFIVNYNDLSMGDLIVSSGWLGEVTMHRDRFETEIRSKAQKLQQPIVRVVSATCDTDLGSTRCGLTDLSAYTFAGTVASGISGNRSFVASGAASAQAAAYFQLGKLTWTSGLNIGRVMEVKTSSGAAFTLVQPMPYAIAVSDTFSVIKGCDKTPQGASNGCVSFGNVINFQGFPFVPGIDDAFRYPGAH